MPLAKKKKKSGGGWRCQLGKAERKGPETFQKELLCYLRTSLASRIE
jgi:hypothetical protein